MKTLLFQLAALVVGSAAVAPAAMAQTAPYPSKPITIVVGFPPGGISDVLARALGQRLSAQMGQNVIVDNKPGAATTIASAHVANAAPDGHTLYFQDMTSHAIAAAAYRNLKFHPWNDFSMVTLVASTPLMLVTSTKSGAKDVKALVAQAKAAPQPLPYASSGQGAITHLTAESFKQIVGINALHVPYKGGAGQTQAIIGGEVVFGFASMPPAIAQMKGGTINGLAVTSGKRVATAPDVPTLREQGVPLEILLYSGLLGPKGMPQAVVDRLGAEVRRALATPEMRRILQDAGADAMTSTPAEFAALMKTEAADMAKAVQSSGVTLE
ncbi:MAG TPA: tripartite tricarboxylate transporter substrate-binding protein [Ramlibacter sp.]|jgi:tripartite-type tricarboxylate transporter receptor subunit TctC|nr:tripartite tricarboxylate transporter substrate-binding protein [Ramlibacter sp.]